MDKYKSILRFICFEILQSILKPIAGTTEMSNILSLPL